MRAGAVVFTTDGGMKALEFVATGVPFDLLVIDFMLPQANGISVTRTLREAGCLMPIIGITANDSDAVRDEWTSAGCNRYLAKPLSERMLLEEVAAALSATSAHSQPLRLGSPPYQDMRLGFAPEPWAIK